MSSVSTPINIEEFGYSLNQLVAIKNIIKFSFQKYLCLPKVIKLHKQWYFINLI